MDKYDLIVSAEKQFAREVTLGVIVQQPLSVWHYLIPGMFIIDFLRRNTAISRYTNHFMFPRKLALDAARDLAQGHDRATVSSRLDSEIENWLNSLDLHSSDLARAQKRAVELLIDHYAGLLAAEGSSYHDLIQNAYITRDKFQAYIDQLTAAEKEVDKAILAKLGESEKLKEKLQLEEQQVSLRRRKILEDIF